MKSFVDALCDHLDDFEEQSRIGFHALMASAHPERGERLNAIKAFYAMMLPRIMAGAKNQWLDVSTVDWSSIFSPIEVVTWQMLRSEGVVMYPQFPVGPWFVDFGNPHVRVGLECDGALYHQDWHRDEARAIDIRKRGWRLIRLTGAECWEEITQGDVQDEVVSHARQVIRSLGVEHGIAA